MQDLMNSEFGELDLIMVEDKIYFPATQCSQILGYKNPQDAIRSKCKGVVKCSPLLREVHKKSITYPRRPLSLNRKQ